MPSRLQKPYRASPAAKQRTFPIHQDNRQDEQEENSPPIPSRAAPDAPTPRSEKTLSTTSPGAMNSIRKSLTGPSLDSKSQAAPLHRSATIRTVPSFDYGSESSTSPRNSGFSSSVNSNASGMSYTSQGHTMQNGGNTRLRDGSPAISPRSESRTPIADAESRAHLTDREMTPRSRNMAYRDENAPPGLSLEVPDGSAQHSHAREASPSPGTWDSTVGKAGLGKTGRVINKLVSDNEALKRDLKIERLRADESKSVAKLLEDKMERLVSDYESRLLEANVTKTLLSRKERQVESLQAAMELEKKRTQDALDRERGWKTEMEQMRRDTSSQVKEAQSYAALMEGRYNTISSHWKDQGGEVDRTVKGITVRITDLVHDRERDDEKISALRDLCDQQDSNIRDLVRQKEEIAAMFDAYKKEQEEQLKEIKKTAEEREREQVETIEESKRVLGQLRWALSVKQNVKGAQ